MNYGNSNIRNYTLIPIEEPFIMFICNSLLLECDSLVGSLVTILAINKPPAPLGLDLSPIISDSNHQLLVFNRV